MTEIRTSHRFRFSLRALFIVTTAAAFLVCYWYTSRRLRESESTVQRLQNETGRLALDDRSVVNVVGVDTNEPDTWRWRLFIPKGHKYMWHATSTNIPFGKIPAQAESSGISNRPYWERDNEVLVTARLSQLPNGNFSLSVTSRIGDSDDQMHGVSLDVPKEHLDWMAASPYQQVDITGKNSAVTFDPSQPFMLFSKRPMTVLPNGDNDFDHGVTEGLAIWLEPK